MKSFPNENAEWDAWLAVPEALTEVIADRLRHDETLEPILAVHRASSPNARKGRMAVPDPFFGLPTLGKADGGA